MTTTGSPASSTDPTTWSTYTKARRSSAGAGLGFVLAEGDGLVCIDLDHCVTDGQIAGWAQDILDRCPATFVEISASGTGLHIWGRGTVARGRRSRSGEQHIEVYGSGRYIALGARFQSSPDTFADLPEVISALT